MKSCHSVVEMQVETPASGRRPRVGQFLVLSQVPSELDNAPATRKTVNPFKSSCLQTIPANPTAVNDVPSFSVTFTIVILVAVLIMCNRPAVPH